MGKERSQEKKKNVDGGQLTEGRKKKTMPKLRVGMPPKTPCLHRGLFKNPLIPACVVTCFTSGAK